MQFKDAMARVVQHQDLDQHDMAAVMRQIMTGQCADVEIAAFLTALRMKGESIDEITGAARVLRELVSPVRVAAEHLVDIVGTGGDGAHLFNVSTASAFVAAAGGAHVAKHGNRGVSSASGSADLLEQAGITLAITPDQVARCIQTLGVGFMFAPAHHAAMKHVAGIRRTLGIRTLFNILGPLANPAGVKNLLVGVFNPALCQPLAAVFRELGCHHVMVVHSRDGLDEISIAQATDVAELKDGQIRTFTLQPEDFGLQPRSLAGLDVSGARDSLALIRDALGSRQGACADKAADMIALNSGAALYVAGITASLAQGVTRAQQIISTGLALEKMQALAQLTEQLATAPEE